MEIFQNWGIRLPSLIPTLINLCFVIIVVLFFLAVIELLNESYREKKLKGLIKEKPLVEKIKKMKMLNTYSNHLELVLKEKDKEGSFKLFFYGSLIFIFSVTFGFVLVKQILLAIISPFVILHFLNKIAVKLSTDIIECMEEQLPFAIDNIIRISTKYGDIKSIIYEASRTCEQPMKGILENIAREMISSSPEKVLIDYAEQYDNVWFYSFVFTLLSYLEDASKDETMMNLRHLRNMLEKENTIKKASITDKKYSIGMNYMIIIASILGFAFNVIFLPVGRQFFFSTFPGLLCFLIGVCCIVSTIFINIQMSKTKK